MDNVVWTNEWLTEDFEGVDLDSFPMQQFQDAVIQAGMEFIQEHTA